MPNTSPGKPPSSRSIAPVASWRQLVAPLVAILLLIVLGRLIGSRWPEIVSAVEGAGLAGQALFVGAAALLVACCFPVAGLALSAGALYGLWPGLPLVVIAFLISSLLMFALGRGMLRGRIQVIIRDRPRLAAIDRMVGERALRLNLLTRLAPLNFGLSSYTLAAGRSGLGTYLIGTAGALPGTAVYVWLGWVARGVGSGGETGTTGGILVLVIGAVAIGVLTWLITRLVRQAWREAEADAPTNSEA
jgi:uncharacterized membrane protein YdjX (TVP38/TMEM64 family)